MSLPAVLHNPFTPAESPRSSTQPRPSLEIKVSKEYVAAMLKPKPPFALSCGKEYRVEHQNMGIPPVRQTGQQNSVSRTQPPSSSTQPCSSLETKVSGNPIVAKNTSELEPFFRKPYAWGYRDTYRNSILHLAVATKPYELCERLVRDKPIGLSLSNTFGEAPYHVAEKRVNSLKGKISDLQQEIYYCESNRRKGNPQDYMRQKMQVQEELQEAQRILALFSSPMNLTSQLPRVTEISEAVAVIPSSKSHFEPPYDWTYRDQRDNTILHLAAEQASLEQCEAMIRECPDEILLLNKRGKDPHNFAVAKLNMLEIDLHATKFWITHNAGKDVAELECYKNKQIQLEIDIAVRKNILYILRMRRLSLQK